MLLPNTDQCVAVLTTISPVTQTADVAVKSALTRPVDVPDKDETGRDKIIVPTKITVAKPITRICCGESFIKPIPQRHYHENTKLLLEPRMETPMFQYGVFIRGLSIS